MASRIPVRKIVIAGALGAVAIVLGATRIGFIPWVLGPGFELTVLMVPVVLGAVLEGPVVGVSVGLIFGVFSMIQDTSGIYKNPVIAILPRLLVGLVAWLVYAPFKGRSGPLERLGTGLGAVAGSLTNTVLVLGGILLFFPAALPFGKALLVVAVNGLPEAVIAAVLTRRGRLALEGHREPYRSSQALEGGVAMLLAVDARNRAISIGFAELDPPKGPPLGPPSGRWLARRTIGVLPGRSSDEYALLLASFAREAGGARRVEACWMSSVVPALTVSSAGPSPRPSASLLSSWDQA